MLFPHNSLPQNGVNMGFVAKNYHGNPTSFSLKIEQLNILLYNDHILFKAKIE